MRYLKRSKMVSGKISPPRGRNDVRSSWSDMLVTTLSPEDSSSSFSSPSISQPDVRLEGDRAGRVGRPDEGAGIGGCRVSRLCGTFLLTILRSAKSDMSGFIVLVAGVSRDRVTRSFRSCSF